MWRSCTDIRFDRLELANLSFEKRGLTLCPARGRAIVNAGADGIRIAAGAPSLDLQGHLGETPIRLASGPVGFAYPGVMKAREIEVSLGPVETASRFNVSGLEARFGDDIAGTFTDADVMLAAVPLYSWIASRWSRGVFVPLANRFFIACLVVFSPRW